MILAIGCAGGVLLATVLVRAVEELLASALFLGGAAYVLGLLAGHHVLDDGVPLVAAGLLACGELATWSVQEQSRGPVERGVPAARAGATFALLVGGLFVAAIVLAVAALPAGAGLGWTVLGAAAAVVVVALARRAAG